MNLNASNGNVWKICSYKVHDTPTQLQAEERNTTK